VYPDSTVSQVLAGRAAGQTYGQLAARFGPSERTIARWCVAPGRPGSRQRFIDQLGEALRPENHRDYAYVLGLYLGDGHVVAMHRGVYALRITLDALYVAIVAEALSSLSRLLPRNRPGVTRRKSRAVDVVSYSKLWPVLLPQHGPGRKHARDVSLVPWQERITATHPQAFLRGLIHSDGSRFVASQRSGGRVYRYPRYYFDNKSRDIITTFCTHLDLLGIRWTRPRWDCVQIARKADVAALDEFVGRKR
jgi:hypothetical protein